MSNSKKYDLLIDIARLIKKYGFETFEDLFKDLSSSLFEDNLTKLIFKSAKVSKGVYIKNDKSKESSRSSRTFRSKLIEMNEKEPGKGQLLLRFHDDLSTNKILPTLRDINNFIVDNDLQPLKAKSRKNAIIPVIKQLIHKEKSDIERILNSIQPVGENDDRSLSGWADIILKRKKPI